MYRLCIVVTRRPLWKGLVTLGNGINQPWMFIGDYNAYLKPTEKSEGNSVTCYMSETLKNVVYKLGCLTYLPRGFYTWWNGYTWCKLDRALVNHDWIGAPFISSVEFLPFGAHSDHAPCIVILKEPGERPIRPFRYYNMWVIHPEFQGIVREVWFEETLGTKKFRLCRKLKLLKQLQK